VPARIGDRSCGTSKKYYWIWNSCAENLAGQMTGVHPHSSSFSHDSCLKSQSQLAAVAVSVVVVALL
jgi:hypothetical protein